MWKIHQRPEIAAAGRAAGANRTLTIHDSGYRFYERERGDSHGPGSGAKFTLGLENFPRKEKVMNKRVKKISLVLVVMMALSMFVTTAFAEQTLQVTAKWWSIEGADSRSGYTTWTASKTVSSTVANKNINVTTGARLKNQGVDENTYYMVVPHTSARPSSRVLVNGGYGNVRGFNFSCVKGKSYRLFQQRYDSMLNTDIVEGITYLYLK